MVRFVTYGAALAVALAALAPASAEPEPLPTGGGCGLTAVEDPGRPGEWSGYVGSYPVITGEARGVPDATAHPASVTVVCTVNVYGDGPARTVGVASGSGTGAATVAPSPVSYSIDDEWAEVHTCTAVHVTDAHGRERSYYLNSQNGMYETDPHVSCGGAQCDSTGPECSYWAAMEQWLVEGGVDGAVCSVLRPLAPGAGDVVRVEPDGDLRLPLVFVWDCPPYEP